MLKHHRNAQFLNDDMLDTMELLEVAIKTSDNNNKLKELNCIMERMKKAHNEIDHVINDIGVCLDWHVANLSEMEYNEE